MLSAEDLHRRGVEAINAGRARAARPLLERGLTRASSDDLRARIEASLAYVAAETGDPAGGLALCGAALEREELSVETRGILQSQRALLQMRSGDVTGALNSFGSAIDYLGTLPGERARAHLNRGGVYLQQGSADAAAGDFADAMRDFSAAGLETEVPKAQHNLGYAAFLAGDLVSALRDMENAAHQLSASSPVLRAISQQDRAEVLMAAGLTLSGVLALEEAARTLGQHRLVQRRGEAELTIARAALAWDPERALAAARAARSRFTRTRTPALRVRAEAVVLGAEVRLRRTKPSLVARADELAEELARLEMPWWAIDTRLDAALVRARRGEIEDARQRMARIRVPARAPLAVRLRERDVRAALAERAGRRTDALAHLRRGLADLHEWQSSFGSLDLQTMVTGHGRRLAVRGLRVAVASGRPDVLFEWSERARMLASRVQPVRVPGDDQVQADLRELRSLATEESSRGSAGRQAELRQRVRERAWQNRGSGEYDDPVSLSDVRARLGADRALVAHVVTSREVAALVVTSESAVMVDLGPRTALDALVGGLLPDLDMAAAELPGVFASAIRSELRGRLGRLDDLLLAPLADVVGDRQLVLTPSGVLATVPWSILPSNDGRPVTVAQSATSWLSRTEVPLRSASAGFVAGPRVAQAEAETSAAAAAWTSAMVLHGPDATAEAVSKLAGSVDVLHVSAHGRHSSENPLFSGFELADGPWFGYDIDQLTSVPDIVLLSACEVGRSTLRGGEELIGMTAAWLHAGSRCVIASAAAINDAVAHDVLVALHRELASGLPPTTALARALAEVDTNGPPAPLVCFG
ncbi:MAG TPA: CHAT domain-containing protein [Nocardioides sp.]|uniref:CHAT domain-containing protein n=1 Tax=Nocardioides sp. TaxID=35761 RepID=UPI002F430040